MIRIDHIAFDFTAPDESFARGLYADWDGFCRRCFERVAEECLAPYGDDRTLHELERLDLDLGNIPEEEFHTEFPRRLKEALLNALPPLHTLQEQASPEKTASSRIGNLLFYLEQGRSLPEWADEGFNPQEETDWLMNQSAASYSEFIRRTAILCLKREHALRRLQRQADNDTVLLDLYAAALAEPSAGSPEKRRLLALLLEERPDVPVRFVHGTTDDAGLREMSALLDTLSVRSIIRTETREHAEVDLPPYWHYLYEWLVRYYPYNGIAMFGGKAEFTRHLHHRLLTFIRGRHGAPYLSKAELTVGFLLEVFGPAYYKDVLNAIYLLQPHNPDGSPVYDGYFNLELYRTFLRLSLLRLPEMPRAEAFTASADGQNGIALLADTEAFAAWLKDTTQSRTGKREQLMTLAKEQPETLVKWLQAEGRQDDALLSLLAELTDDKILYGLLASLPFFAWKRVEKVAKYLERHTTTIIWLKDTPAVTLQSSMRKSVIKWISGGHYRLDEETSIHHLLLLLCQELGGTMDETNEKETEELAAILSVESGQNDIPVDTERIITLLKDPKRSTDYKRTLLAMLVKEQPEMLVKWLQAEGRQDDVLLSLLAELADDATLYRLIASLSFAASETAKAIQTYMEKHRSATGWLKDQSETRLAQVFKLSVFRWPANGKEDAESLLRIVYKETTGKEDDAAVETLAREMERDNALPEEDERSEKGKAGILHLQAILSNPILSDTLKRRTVARFWDSHREDYARAVRLLQENNLLSEAVWLTGRNAWAELVRRMAMQVSGMDAASGILLLLERLTAQEDNVSRYLTEGIHGIRSGILLWLARQGENHAGIGQREAAHSLLTFLFVKEDVPLVLKQMAQENASGSEDTGQLWELLENSIGYEPYALQTAYKEWKHSHKGASDTLRILFESRWHTAEGFAGWLDDTSITASDKREWLHEAATGKPSEWLRLLRALPEGSKALVSLGTLLTAQDLTGSLALANFHQASVLSGVMERLWHPSVSLPVSLTDSGIPLETLLRKALLAYLQDPEASGRTLSEREITDRFLSYLRLAATGKENNDADKTQWQQLAEAIINDGESEYTAGLSKEKLLQALADPSASHIALRQALVGLMDGQPDELVIWLEQNTDTNKIYRLSEISDGLTASHWANRLAAMPGFAHPDAFRQLTAWLLRRMSASELAAALFLYVKEPGWRTFTPEQMEAYFFSRLYGKIQTPSIEETLADGSLPEAARQRLFRHYLRHRPEQLLAFIRKTVRQNTLPLGRWLERTDASDWLQLAASLSLARAELLRQIADSLSLSEEERKKAFAIYMIYGDTEEWPYATPRETVRSFIEVQGMDAERAAEAVRQVEKELALPEEMPPPEDAPEVLTVGNAGLCLLAPWFVRLFAMLGYLDEDRRQFRGTASKVRAVFLLQYLAYGEERAWRETELAFNRLLTALPGHVPLPKHLALTDEERQTADGMVAGVKANWPQMSGTSAESFRQSFLVRKGTLEQQEERWLLAVEEKAYDVLLDTVPWGFRQIRLPWLKKYVQVRWQEKQTF